MVPYIQCVVQGFAIPAATGRNCLAIGSRHNAMFAAVRHGQPGMVRYLVQQGASLEARDNRWVVLKGWDARGATGYGHHHMHVRAEAWHVLFDGSLISKGASLATCSAWQADLGCCSLCSTTGPVTSNAWTCQAGTSGGICHSGRYQRLCSQQQGLLMMARQLSQQRAPSSIVDTCLRSWPSIRAWQHCHRPA